MHQFLQDHALELNLGKTQFLLIHRSPQQITRPLAPLVLAGTIVPPNDKVKYLGIIIDTHLAFTDQVSSVVGKVAAKLKVFRRTRSKLTVVAKRTFYLSFIQSTLEYGSNAYVHSLYSADFNRLVCTAKRAVRLIFGFPSHAHSAPILARFNLVPISVRYSLKLFLLVHRCLAGNASSLLSCRFMLRCQHDHTTSQTRAQATRALALPKASSRAGLFSLSYLAADRWNSLPSDLRTTGSHVLFRTHLLTWLGIAPNS